MNENLIAVAGLSVLGFITLVWFEAKRYGSTKTKYQIIKGTDEALKKSKKKALSIVRKYDDFGKWVRNKGGAAGSKARKTKDRKSDDRQGKR